MSTIDSWKLVRVVDRQAAGQVGAQVRRPMVTTRQATRSMDAALASTANCAASISLLNSAAGGARFMWDMSTPFGWDSGEWD